MQSDRDIKRIWLDVDGLRIRCLHAGTGGPPALLLHGGGFDSAAFSYRYVIGPLSRERRVFAPDWPGYGESEKPALRYDLAFYAGFLHKLIDALGLDRVDLVGLSMGGGAALRYALGSRDRVRKLVLVSSYGLGREVPYGLLGSLAVRTGIAAPLVYALMRRSRRLLSMGLRSVVHDPRIATDALLEEARAMLHQPGAGRAFHSFRRQEVGWRGLRTDLSHRLHEVSAPTLLVHGAHDGIVPAAWAIRARERLPRGELHILEDCGHWPPRERPEEFNRVVGVFLSR